ncbi:MAG: ArgE/DapE family deacylase [Armatimonadota bacterium]|nr:ArgE/DapE family deacylase [Armatimonadota bacterium]MDR7452447.1 ArgE/DapE family deacylase [Armatimonadota bacterium]MDR7466185.1 ArgE/DapE family deacylase [Armatimonadota bacterium]MDR7495132.1 ArgE/DapE family deacylase [Armatimonadota bacterium]MDR7505798.1 ArgE/DapE family deacylase [Armatimonadota bacterium]
MEPLLEAIGQQEEDLVGLCRRLIQIPSENPPGDVRELATFVAETLTAWGIAPIWHEPAPGRANIVASIGPTDGKTLILNGHLDVVPAGKPGRWSHPPFAGDVSGGLLYGRGAVDMKGGVAALMIAFRALAATVLPGRIILALTADEETGGRWGTRWLVEHAGLHGDGALIAEPSGPGIATIGQKGVLWLKVKSVGSAAHGSLSPYAGTNAILRLTDALPVFTALAGRSGDFPDALRPILRRSKTRMAAAVGETAIQALDHVTVNIGTIRGGTKVNVVPDEAVAEIDIRVPLGCSAGAIRDEIEASLTARGLILEECTVSEPNYTEPEADVARALARAVEVVAGQQPEFLLQWATSDARHFRAAGIPVVQYGPWGQGIHGDDEAVYIDHLTHCAKVYAILSHTFLAVPPRDAPPVRP